MPKRRKKKTEEKATSSNRRLGFVDFVEVTSAKLIQIEEEDPQGVDVAGAFVKLTPSIPASRRETYEGAAVSARLRARGARVVVIDPRIIPEAVRPEAERIRIAPTPRDAVAAWFADQITVAEEDRSQAEELVLAFMDSEGL